MNEQVVSTLASVAIRVHDMEKMVDFYTRAFGGSFRPVEFAPEMVCQFGSVAGVTLKLVPLRESADFEGYPLHQLGFGVDDVERVIALATELGGKQEGEIQRSEQGVHGAVRDPDGNTVELYARPGG